MVGYEVLIELCHWEEYGELVPPNVQPQEDVNVNTEADGYIPEVDDYVLEVETDDATKTGHVAKKGHAPTIEVLFSSDSVADSEPEYGLEDYEESGSE